LARILVSPYLGRKPKAKVTTIKFLGMSFIRIRLAFGFTS
jgi:hypothetical protein